MKISICIPVYNGRKTIKDTLDSIFNQEFVKLYEDLEVVICNNASIDRTLDVIHKYKDKRIKVFNYTEYSEFNKSLEHCVVNTTGDVIIFISANDVFLNGSIFDIYQAFKDDDLAILVRPYYLFYKDPLKPIRFTRQHGTNTLFLLETLTQFSGIAISKKFITTDFSPFPFIEFAWMAFPICFKGKVGILDKPNVAVRAEQSGATQLKAFKYHSYSLNWKELIEKFVSDKKVQKELFDGFVRHNYVGLIPLRAYSDMRSFLNELKYLDWNDLRFIAYVIPLLITPRRVLRWMIVKWKEIKERNATAYLC